MRSRFASASRLRRSITPPIEVPHRYWRLANMDVASTTPTSPVQIAEIQFRETAGGANLATGGTAFASEGTPANAFDNNPTTVWAGTKNLSPTIGYDFGTPVFIREFTIRPGTSVTNNRTPYQFDLQWSDDGTTWTNHCRRIHRMLDASVATPFPAGGDAYRILGTSGSGPQARWAELRLSETPAGVDVAEGAAMISAEGGSTSTDPVVLDIALLFDGLTNAYFLATNFYFYFGGSMDIAEIGFVSQNATNHVAAFDLQKSTDGGFNWTSEISASGIPRPSDNVTWSVFP